MEARMAEPRPLGEFAGRPDTFGGKPGIPDRVAFFRGYPGADTNHVSPPAGIGQVWFDRVCRLCWLAVFVGGATAMSWWFVGEPLPVWLAHFWLAHVCWRCWMAWGGRVAGIS